MNKTILSDVTKRAMGNLAMEKYIGMEVGVYSSQVYRPLLCKTS